MSDPQYKIGQWNWGPNELLILAQCPLHKSVAHQHQRWQEQVYQGVKLSRIDLDICGQHMTQFSYYTIVSSVAGPSTFLLNDRPLIDNGGRIGTYYENRCKSKSFILFTIALHRESQRPFWWPILTILVEHSSASS